MKAAYGVGLFSAVVLLSSTPLLGAKPEAPVTGDHVVDLPEYKVTPTFHCNFGIGIAVYGDSKKGTLKHVFIEDVIEGTAAEKYGLKRGDEILSVNGKKVTDMKGGIKVDGDLFNLLIDRPPGEKIKVEVAVRVVTALRAARLIGETSRRPGEGWRRGWDSNPRYGVTRTTV